MNPADKIDPTLTPMPEAGTNQAASDFAHGLGVAKPAQYGRYLTGALMLGAVVAYLHWPPDAQKHLPRHHPADSLTALVGAAAPVFKPAPKSLEGALSVAPVAALPPPTSVLVPPSLDGNQVAKLSAQLAASAELLKAQQQDFAVQRRALEAQLKGLGEQVGHLQKQMAKRVAMVDKPAAKATRTQGAVSAVAKPLPPATLKAVALKAHPPAAAKTPVPPFRLVSIDRWGDDTQVVVRHVGQLQALTLGQSLSGWKVTGLDETGGGVLVVGSGGRHALLTLD